MKGIGVQWPKNGKNSAMNDIFFKKGSHIFILTHCVVSLWYASKYRVHDPKSKYGFFGAFSGLEQI